MEKKENVIKSQLHQIMKDSVFGKNITPSDNLYDEEKQILLKDLCGRLKSNLICKVTYKDSEGWKEEDMVLSGIIDDEGYFIYKNGSVYSSEFKPYLRTMSSMTYEEREKFVFGFGSDLYGNIERIDWLIANHFDYRGSIPFEERGLIPMGLALKAPKGMYD